MNDKISMIMHTDLMTLHTFGLKSYTIKLLGSHAHLSDKTFHCVTKKFILAYCACIWPGCTSSRIAPHVMFLHISLPHMVGTYVHFTLLLVHFSQYQSRHDYRLCVNALTIH